MKHTTTAPAGATVHHRDAHILVFAKAPRPGAVKTRLIPLLGAEGAAALHRLLATHTVATVCGAALAPATLCCPPPVDDPFLCRLAEDAGMALAPQDGADLGTRMARALATAQRRSRRVLLVGTDCPSLDDADLHEALEALQHHDAVFGPAEDGGYVLVGLSRPVDPRLFDGIDWGSGRVMAQTRARLRQLGWRHYELAPRRDLDRPEDLARLWA